MTMKEATARHSPEVRKRAMRLVLEGGGQHQTQWAAINPVSSMIGCTAETLRKWVRQAERDRGVRAGPATAENERGRSPAGIRGRADLQGAADRPVDLPRPGGAAG